MQFLKDVGNKILDILESRLWEIIAIILMLVPVVISFSPLTREFEKYTFLFWGKTTEQETLSIEPRFISMLFAIILHFILLARCIGKYFESGFSIVIFALNALFTASFISIFISSDTYTIPIINQPMSSQTLMILAVILSLTSIRAVAGFIWILLAILAIFRVAAIDSAMGPLGAIYFLSASISLGIQLFKLKLLEINKDDLMNEFRGASNVVFGDIKNSTNLIKDGINYSENLLNMGNSITKNKLTSNDNKDNEKLLIDNKKNKTK